MIDLKGRTIIVTGAGNGLGRAHALLAGRLGANVVVNDLGGSNEGRGASEAPADFVVEEIRSSGGTAVANYDSISIQENCEGLIQSALDRFGRLDAVIHNVGIMRNAPIREMANELFFPVLETHLLGGFYLSRAAFPAMVEQGFGRFVFTSSAVGVWGCRGGPTNYGSAKAGLVGLTNVIGHEGEELGIKANAIMPLAQSRIWSGGPDDYQRGPEADAARAARDGDDPRNLPAWVSPLVIYLASDACRVNCRCYSAGRGRYARIFMGVTPGWFAPDGTPTPDEVAEHLDEIEDRAEYDLPDDVYHEVELIDQRDPKGAR